MNNNDNPNLLPNNIPGADIFNRAVLENRDLTDQEKADLDAILDAIDEANDFY
jgi:hypothetical protein